MPYTPIMATLGYVMSADGSKALMIHRNTRPGDMLLGKYNGLGGKMETDEDILACMHREIREESGLELRSLRYVGSQPWPFPRSLMLGFVARAVGAVLSAS